MFSFTSMSSQTNSVLCCLVLHPNPPPKNDSKISHKSTSTHQLNPHPKGFPQTQAFP
jgi:hypothetical protein